MFKREIGKGGLLLMTSLRIREDVFMDEQGIDRSLLTDDKDRDAFHGIVYDFGIPVASGRLYRDSEDESVYHAGRIAVNKEYRGKGLGRDLMIGLIEKAWEVGAEKVSLHAQEQVIGFYEKLGFVGVGDIFMEAGIPHLEMEVVKK